MIPGMYPRQQSSTLMSRSEVHPRSMKTPTGGRKIAVLVGGRRGVKMVLSADDWLMTLRM